MILVTSNVLNLDYIPYLTFGILIFFIILALYCYIKVRRWLLSFTIFVFSLIIGVYSFNEANLPFAPMFQIFFLFFQVVIFIIITIEAGTND